MKTIIAAFALLFFSSLRAQILNHQDFYPSQFGVDSTIEYFGNQIAHYPTSSNDTLQYFISSSLYYNLGSTEDRNGGIFIGGFDKTGQLQFSKDLTLEIISMIPEEVNTILYFRHGVDFAGDLNDDGIVDLVIGSPISPINNEGDNEHLTLVYMNKNFSPDSVKIINSFDLGYKNKYNFGSRVKNIGDWDNNGYDDFAISMPGFDIESMEGESNGGIVLLFLGNASEIINTKFIENTTTDVNSVSWGFGTGLIGNLDMNNDGVNDLIVGTPHGSEYGNVSIYYLDNDQNVMSTAIIDNTTLPAQLFEDDDHFGQAITSPGDLNNDGIPELLISMHWSEVGVHHAGKLYIVSLDRIGNILDFAEVFDKNREDDYLGFDDHFGRDIIVMDDFNGDGFNEILASIDDDTNDYRGKLRLIYTNYDYLLGASSSLNELKVNLSIDIFPNPSTNTINVKSKDLVSQRFKIVNSLGINVVTGYLNDNQSINISQLPIGAYYLAFIDSLQKESMGKFIKQ